MPTTHEAESQATHRKQPLDAPLGLRLAVVALLTFSTAACGGASGSATTSNRPPAAATSSAAPSAGTPAATRATPSQSTTRAPQVVTPPPPPQAPEPQVSAGVANATRFARSYLDYAGFSRTSLIEQLEYEGYTTDEATTAVDGLDVDYDAKAVESAQSYLDYTSFSRSGLVDQLKFEGYTPAQAEYGLSQTYGG